MSEALPVRQPSRSEQIGIVGDWLCAGMRRSRVPGYAAEAGWQSTAAELEAMVSEAMDALHADAQVERPGCDMREALEIGRLRSVYAAAVRDGEYRAAAAALARLSPAPPAKYGPGRPGLLDPRWRPHELQLLDARQVLLLKSITVPALGVGNGNGKTHPADVEIEAGAGQAARPRGRPRR